MDIVIMIVVTTIVLGFLVFIHEGGHFLAAKAFGVRVSEFMIGLPGPSLGFTKGETRFGITAVPLGGYARVCGMSPFSNSPHLKRVLNYVYQKGTVYMEDVAHDLCLDEDEAYDLLEELADWGSVNRPKRKDKHNVYRVPKNLSQTVLPLRVQNEGSPEPCVKEIALATGEGAALTANEDATCKHKEGEPCPVSDPEAFYQAERSRQYGALPFWKRCVILLAGPFMNVAWVIVAFIIICSVMGLDLQNTSTGEVFHHNWAPWESVYLGVSYLGMVLQAIAGLFNPATAAQTLSDSTSIVGIAVLSKSYFEAGLQEFLFFTAVISASLGFMNLLPIPPLDGGRFVVEVFQKVSRKIVSLRALGYMSMVGILLFAGLFVVMLNQDVQRFVLGNWG